MLPRRQALTRCALLALGLLGITAAIQARQAEDVRKPEVWAVLVGIDEYESPRIPSCPLARSDALALRSWFQREAGWPADHVLVMDRFSRRRHLAPALPLADLYPSKENLSWVLNSWLPARVQPGDLVVIYFAGQAVSLPPRENAPPDSPSKGYLLPIDADPGNIPGSGWTIEGDLDTLAAGGRNPLFVLLDTSLAGRGRPVFEQPEIDPASRWLATVARWPTVSAWLAADGRVADEGESRGPFISALLEGLGTPDHRRNLLACLARMRRDPQLIAQGFRSSGSVPSEATLWSVDLTPRPVTPPQLVLRNGHSDRVLDLALTADGGTLISASLDSTVKLWRTEDRALLRTLSQHFIGVTQIVVSPNGKRLASGDGAGSVWIYALPDFTPLQTRAIRPHEGRIEALAFLDDGERLASLDIQGNLLLWDVSGPTTEPEKLPIIASAMSAGDGRLAASRLDPRLQNASRFTVFDRDGKVLLERPGPGGLTSLGMLAIDGDRLAIADREGGVALWSLDGEGSLVRRESLPSPVKTLAWAATGVLVAAGDSIHRIPAVVDGAITVIDTGETVELLATASGDRLLAAASRDGQPRVWNLANLEAPRAIELTTPLDERGTTSITQSSSLRFTPGGDALVVGCSSGAIRAWTIPEAVPRPEIPAHRGRIRDLAVSPDARYLLQVTSDGDADLWDLDLGRSLQPIPGRWTSGIFLADSETLALTSQDGAVILFDRVQGQRVERAFELPQIAGRAQRSNVAFDRLAASPDGNYLAAGSTFTDLACLWDLESGRLVRPIRAHPDGVTEVAFSADSRHLFTVGNEGLARLWAVEEDRAGGPRLVLGAGDDGPPVTAAAIDPRAAGRIILGDQDGRVVRWSLDPNGKPVSEVLDTLRGTVRALAFSAGGDWLAAAGEAKEVHLVDLRGPRPRSIRLDPRHDEEVTSLVAWPDVPILASGSADTTIRLWRFDDQSLLGTLAGTTATGTWVAYTPGGHFDSSPGAEQSLARVHGDGRVAALELDYDRLRTFRLAATLRRGSAPQPLPIFDPSQLPTLVLDPPPGRSPSRTASLTLTLGESGLQAFRLYLNGIPIRDHEDFLHPDPDDPRRLVVEAPLRRGRNELYVMAGRDEPGAPLGRSNTVSVTYDGPETPGRLHILALGIDDYPNRPLKFSAADATMLVDFLGSNHVDADLQGAHVRVLTNTEVNRESVREALAAIRLQARPDDTVAVFIAGHTDLRTDPVGREQFCLLLPNYPFPEIDQGILTDEGIRVAMRGNLPVAPATPPNNAPPEAILPYSEIEQWLVRMDALQRLVILDVCQAEAVLDDPVAHQRRENAASKVDDDAHRARTTYLFASRRDMPALEVDNLGHGLLTYVLLRGMGAVGLPEPEGAGVVPVVPVGGADLDKDSLITTTELSTFADRVLPPLIVHYTGSAQRAGEELPQVPATPAFTPASLQAADESSFPLIRVPR